MTETELLSLENTYHADETAWLDEMAARIRAGRVDELDYRNLAEFLSDMAKRDKREVFHRLVVLLVHVLKWDAQPDKRSRSWELSISEQREELQELLTSGSLRNFAETELSRAYQKAVRRAAVETGLDEDHFPGAWTKSLNNLLGE